MIAIRCKGDFKRTDNWLKKLLKRDYKSLMEKYAQEGVEALAAATPVDSGKTATSWSYEITQNDGEIIIAWNNSNINKHVNIALIIQYGHGTRNGGWVQGVDYINPALKPIFDKMANAAWKEVIGFEYSNR